MIRPFISLFLSLGCFFFLQYFVVQSKTSNKVTKARDPNDTKGNTPFFLQDPVDHMCLGPNGFTVCDEDALWILTKRAGKSTYSLVSLLTATKDPCLQRKSTFLGLVASDEVGVGSCKKSSSQSWSFDFVDQRHVKLSNKGQCLVRGKKGFKNSVSVKNCNDGEFTPLHYHPTAVHENGFYLKAADGQCFDGSRFRPCTGSASSSSKLLWGVGIKYIWGEAQRYFFNFAPQDKSKCLVARGSRVEVGPCTDKGALKWGLSNGELTANYGQSCVARKVDDTAVLVPCSSKKFEYISLEVPTTYTNEQLSSMLQSPNLSQKDRETLTEAINRRSSRM